MPKQPYQTNSEHSDNELASDEPTAAEEESAAESDDDPYMPALEPIPASRRNPERMRRPPARYQAFEVNSLEIAPKPIARVQGIVQPGQPAPRLLGIGRGLLALFIMCVCFGGQPTQAQIFNSSKGLGQFMGTARLCGTRGKHSAYIWMPSPEETDCDVPDTRERKVTTMHIIPYFQKILSEAVEAYACELEISTITTFYSFFGAKSIINRSIRYEPYNLVLCQFEINNIKNKRSKLIVLAPDVYSNATTTVAPVYEWCCGNSIATQYRLRVRKFDIRFNFRTSHVVSTLYPTEVCKAELKFCVLSTATLIWETNINKTCDMVQGDNVLADFTDTEGPEGEWRMVSEAGQLALSGHWNETETHCGRKLHSSRQGIFMEIDEKFSTETFPGKRGISTSYMGQLSFVTRHLEDLSMKLFRQAWMGICQLQKQNSYWIGNLMRNPLTAYLAARMLLKTDDVIAYPAGQLLQVQSCQTFDEYYWTPTERCSYTIPIKFGSDNHTGYLVPASRDIKLMDAIYPCDHEIQEYIVFTKNGKWGGIWMWNGSVIMKTNVKATRTELLQHFVDIPHVQLLASHVYDATAEALDTITDDNSKEMMSQSMLTLLRAAGTDIVTFDPKAIAHAAEATTEAIQSTVENTLQHFNPFFRWMRIIIIVGAIIIAIVLAIYIIVRVRLCLQISRNDEMVQNLLRATYHVGANEDEAVNVSNAPNAAEMAVE